MQKKKIKNINRTLKLLLFVTLAIGISFILVRPALADPHAMFYTDKGQEQVFYNFLAALNQADYVEAPPQIQEGGLIYSQPGTQPGPTSPPNINYSTAIGNYLANGVYSPPPGQRQATTTVDENGNITNVTTTGTSGVGLEPQERTNLPHITVRSVTSDNGDVYTREAMQRQALAEQMRVEFSALSCRLLEGLYGPNVVKDPNNPTADGKSPCDQYLPNNGQ